MAGPLLLYLLYLKVKTVCLFFAVKLDKRGLRSEKIIYSII